MSRYSDFFLNSNASVIQYDTLVISHPDFTTTYRVVRNAPLGLTATLEDSSVVEFLYYPLRIVGIGTRDNMDFGLRIDLGDLGEVLPQELDAVSSADGFLNRPSVVYRTFRSDDLTGGPIFGPIALEVDLFHFTRDGISFTARAPALNNIATGELYKIDRFPMLRGFL